jgi:Cytochrome oxidase complex assembly protein 1
MSMARNDPFENPNAPGFNQPQTPPKKGNGWLIGCAIAGLLGVLICCGGGAFLTYFGMGKAGDAIVEQFSAHPTVVENFGEIESAKISWGDTVEASQGGESIMSVDIKGSKSDGKLQFSQDKSTGEFKSVVLIMPDGTRIPIDVEGQSEPGLEEIETNFDDMIDTGESAPETPETPSEPTPVETP